MMKEKDEVFNPPFERPLSSHNGPRYNLEQTRAAGKLHSSNASPFTFQGLCGIAGHKVLSQQGHLVPTRVLAGSKQVVILREETKQLLIMFHCRFKMCFCISGQCCCTLNSPVRFWISSVTYLNVEYMEVIHANLAPALLLLSGQHLESTIIVYAQPAAASSCNQRAVCNKRNLSPHGHQRGSQSWIKINHGRL